MESEEQTPEQGEVRGNLPAQFECQSKGEAPLHDSLAHPLASSSQKQGPDVTKGKTLSISKAEGMPWMDGSSEVRPEKRGMAVVVTPLSKAKEEKMRKLKHPKVHRLVWKDIADADEQRYRHTQFEWLNEDGSWIPYPRAECQKMWDQLEHIKSDQELIYDYAEYKLDFQKMTQSRAYQWEDATSLFDEDSKAGDDSVRPIRRSLVHLPNGPAYWQDVCCPYDIDILWYDHTDPIGNPPHPDIEEAIMALQQGCPELEIMKVEVNVNRPLWDQYYNFRNKKREILKEKFEERVLWHGTSHVAAPLICAGGFNRTFVTKHNYGQGTYFARSPRVSARTEYAGFHPNSCQTLIYCYVVVGRSVVGSPQLKDAPMLPGQEDEMYDSTVDVSPHAKIYTTYLDIQAYPAVVFTVRHKLEEEREDEAEKH